MANKWVNNGVVWENCSQVECENCALPSYGLQRQSQIYIFESRNLQKPSPPLLITVSNKSIVEGSVGELI